jgi:uncharacterized protein (DUF1697 family)
MSENLESRAAMPNLTSRYVAFLRGINVGGHRIKMDRLRDLFVTLGFQGVSTFIASGNVLFETATNDPRKLEMKIEAHLKASLGYEVSTFLRTTAELSAIASHRPFPGDEAGHTLHVGLIHEVPANDLAAGLRALQTERDEFAVHGREIYWRCLGKTTDSLASWPLVAKTIRVPSTMRNVTTLRTLAAKYETDA